MKIEIPDFLLKMSEEMNAQDERGTADVIYQVKQRQYIPTKEDINDHHFILCDETGDFFRSDTDLEKDAKDHLLKHYEEACADWVAQEFDHDKINERGIEELFQENFKLSNDAVYIHGDIEKIHMQEIDDVRHTCFTEQEANRLKERYQNQDLVYIYGSSISYTEETKALRNWIKDLSKKSDEDAHTTETDKIIFSLFSSRWSGDLSSASIEDMRKQLYKNLKDQVNGYWSGHTAYNIMVDGGFLIDSKRESIEGSNSCKPKKLTMLGEMFMKDMESQLS